MSKTDEIRCFTADIAQWRVDGLTWAQIAAKLCEEDIRVGTDEIRSYWPRLSEGRSPAEYLLYWQSSQRNAELREAWRRVDAAEAEIERLQQEVQAWERQMQPWPLQDQQRDALRAECDGLHEQLEETLAQLAESQRGQYDLERLRNESSQRERTATKQIQKLQNQIGTLTERAALADIYQREAEEAPQLRQQVSDLQRQHAEAEARTAKAREDGEFYGNIRYFVGMSDGQAQLDEANKNLEGWISFGKALALAHQSGNWAEVSRLLDQIAAWATPRGKA